MKGITAYGNQIYILSDDEVFIYSSTGEYQNRFDVQNNITSSGMTTYNNQFYIIDNYEYLEVNIYSSTGVYQSNFNLHANNFLPNGIMTYRNQFYIMDVSTMKSSFTVVQEYINLILVYMLIILGLME